MDIKQILIIHGGNTFANHSDYIDHIKNSEVDKTRLYSTIKYKLSHVDTMTGLEFEKYVAKYLRNQGYKTNLTEKYDLGIDIVAVQDGIRQGVQVKRYKGVVGANAVRQSVTALNLYDCDRAMVVTNSYFSNTASQQ